MEPKAKINTTWHNMIARCCKTNYRDYPRYGGRGVTVCDRWMIRKNFVDDMFGSMLIHYDKYGSRNTTLDRINGSKGYSPENCRWITSLANTKNLLPKQIDSRTIVLVCLSTNESYTFMKIADASRFLPGDYDSNRRMITAYLKDGKYKSVKGYWLYTKMELELGVRHIAMRDVIKKAIEEGGATKESLLELTGTTEKGLASQFTYLRMMGNCPMKQDDGTWKIVSTEEWEAHRGAGGATAANLTPEQRVERAGKRSKRAASAFDNAKIRHEAKPDDRLTELKFLKASAELEISEIELGLVEEVLRNMPKEDVEVSDDEVTEEVDEAVEEDLQ